MDAGRLRKLVSIRQQSTSHDTLNQSLSVWTQIANGQVWACVEPQSATEAYKQPLAIPLVPQPALPELRHAGQECLAAKQIG